jgi:hypothetical protein
LAGVPEAQLTRITRLAASAGFLSEPQPGLLAHTTLSAAFVTNAAYADAIFFLAKTVVPSASHMTAVTRADQGPDPLGNAKRSAYSRAFGIDSSFQSVCEERPKLSRQHKAYLQCMGEVDEQADDADAAELLFKLNWSTVGNARIVIVSLRLSEACYSPVFKRMN